MGQIRFIEYGSREYDRTLALRNKVMRIPLGLDIYREDFSFERECVILGMFEAGQLLGVGVMSNKEDSYKLEYLCVDSQRQKGGIGGELLRRLEKIAEAQGGEKIWMDARVSAERFYKRHGYQAVGEIFLLDYAPVEHIIMEKKL
jgi:ribosomal protein S18 acetylase RimI-like enzyme